MTATGRQTVRIPAQAPPRRIRHQARDTLAVAAFSLGASAAATAFVWAMLWVLS